MNHQFHDKYLKYGVMIFASVILQLLGLNYIVTGIHRNEMLDNEGRSLFADLVLTTFEDVLIDFEFQDVKITKKHLKKYLDYKNNLQCKYKMPVVTIIICSYHIKSKNLVLYETESSVFKPIVLYLCDFDKIGIFKSIKNKLKNNEMLSDKDQQYLLLLPLMYLKKDRGKIVEDICNLLIDTNGRNEYIVTKLRFALILAIRQYVDDDKKEELERMIKMGIEPEYLVDLDKVRESYNNGANYGVLKTRKEVILSLLDYGFDIDQISEMLKLDLSFIRKLLDG